MKHISSKSSVSYRVTHDGFHGWFSQDGYSQYFKRINLYRDGKLPDGEQIYGYAQAIEHIAELRKSEYMGELHYADTVFYVEVIGTLTTMILPDEGTPTKTTKAKEIEKFGLHNRVSMYNHGTGTYMYGTVLRIGNNSIYIKWEGYNALKEYTKDEVHLILPLHESPL